MGIAMDQPCAHVDWRQFVTQVGEAPLEEPHGQRRFPSARGRRQHTDTTRKRHSRRVNEVQVGALVLQRYREALVKVPQKRVCVVDVSDQPIEIANTEALPCVVTFNLVAPRFVRARPEKGDYQGTEGELN